VTEGTAFIIAEANEADVYCIPKKVKPWSITGLKHQIHYHQNTFNGEKPS